MIKKFIIFFFISAGAHFPLLAQEYGTEWINYSQNYYKMPVGKDGMYRINYSDLINAGLPLSSIDPRKMQIFHRGVEQAIYIEGELDARFDPSDHIIFYGTRNDGTLDKKLYHPNSAQPHPYYNLYSDTTSYFLTWKFTGNNGKRMENFKETNTTGIPREVAQYTVFRDIYFNQYSGGRTFKDYTQFSQFDIGEGWTGTYIQENQTIDYTLNGLGGGVAAGGQPVLKIHLQGRDDMLHRAEISVGPDVVNLRVLGTIDFNDYESGVFESPVNWSDIAASGALMVRVRALGPEGNDLLSVSYNQITIPKGFDQQGRAVFSIELKENESGKSYLVVNNIATGTVFYDITNKDAVKKIGYNISGNDAQLVVPQTQVRRKLLAASNYITPLLRKVNFRRIDLNNAGFIIVTHPVLMQPAGGYEDAVRAYAAYRNSAAGGSYDTLVVNINQLYDQFNYGEISPLAIFNFVRWMKNNATPEFLFFIGEGLEVRYNYHRRPDQFVYKDLVPTAGFPASDIIYSSGPDGYTYLPAIPTGRLTASEPQQVINYLEKVKVMEALPYNALWRKNVLHLSGGIRDAELVAFRNIMDRFAKIAEGPFLGGNVRTIQKNTRSTSEFINVSDEINKGVNLVTFFGHSAPSITDIDIGFVTNPVLGYNNINKYPVFLVNGCNAGQFFLNNFLFGEDWVLAAKKGSIGFIAHTSYGYPSSLSRYSSIFYNVGYANEEFIEKSLGQIQQETISKFTQQDTLLPDQVAMNQQMFLLGDPATKLFGAKAPDYTLDQNSVFVTSFDGLPVTALSDSFAINVIAKNFGKAPPDSIKINVRRTFPDGSISEQVPVFRSVLYSDTLQLVVLNRGLQDFGNNNFLIIIDPDNEHQELNETNNSISFDYYIKLNSTRNLLPYNYALIDQTINKITVQSTDVMSPERSFLIELDTVVDFNSPARKSTIITDRLLADWQPGWLNKDTVTYFLRSKFKDAASGEVDEWYTSSFTRIMDGNLGWAQRKPHQLSENSFSGLVFDPVTGNISFYEKVLDVDVRIPGSGSGDNITGFSVLIDNVEYNIDNGSRCRDNTINFIAYNKETAIPYAAIPFEYKDERTCGRQPQIINSFISSELLTGMQDDISEMISRIDKGDSVLIFTIGNAAFSTWPLSVREKLQALGIPLGLWDELKDGEPVIIRGRKGAPAGAAEVIRTSLTPAEEQELISEMSFTGISSSGQVKTPLIGPSMAWDDLKILAARDINDELTVEVEAFDLQGNSVVALSSADFETDLSSIDAKQYPFIRITLDVRDPENLTAPQLRQWFVRYTPAPEGIILPVSLDTAQKKQEGDSLHINPSFYNLSPWSFADSLVVSYSVTNTTSKTAHQEQFKIAGPVAGDTVAFDFIVPTLGKVGLNDINVTVNPGLVPEQYYENNTIIASDYLEVIQDKAAPLLDVRFDGRHIFNRDIVSPDPLISVVIKDENQYLARKDTTGIDIFLKSSCEGCDFQRISFSDNKVKTVPGSGNNEYVIEYKPGPLEDGIYTLRIQAADVSGNTAGEGPYEIEFEVINESTVTNFYPYPNPFSSNVRFIFTLTGNDMPDQMLIQIMTVSGRVVKEISLGEFGLLRIGNNISDYAWDGRDEFGDQLANGVYLYKVILKKGGREIKQRSTAGDGLFKNGYGKLYLLR